MPLVFLGASPYGRDKGAQRGPEWDFGSYPTWVNLCWEGFLSCNSCQTPQNKQLVIAAVVLFTQ